MSANTYRDYMSHMQTQALADSIFDVVDAHQKATSPEAGFAAIAATLVMMAKEIGIPLNDVLGYTHNALAHLEETNTEKHRAIREYFKGEL